MNLEIIIHLLITISILIIIIIASYVKYVIIMTVVNRAHIKY